MKTNTKTMRTIMFISLAIAMVLIPANTATANEFTQNRKEYETALNHTVTLTARLKQDTENVQNKTIVTRDDDDATRIARKALQSQLTEATKIHMSQKEKATVFTVSFLWFSTFCPFRLLEVFVFSTALRGVCVFMVLRDFASFSRCDIVESFTQTS